jgi:hypothetical protein
MEVASAAGTDGGDRSSVDTTKNGSAAIAAVIVLCSSVCSRGDQVTAIDREHRPHPPPLRGRRRDMRHIDQARLEFARLSISAASGLFAGIFGNH